MTVSFFVHLDDARFPKSPSTVKFGSWDASSITGQLTMIRTKTKTSWDIRCNLFKFDKDDEGLKLSSLLRIDPGLPYLYFPDTVYASFTTFVNKKYPGTCVPGVNICKF
jgi:hypothetical protein